MHHEWPGRGLKSSLAEDSRKLESCTLRLREGAAGRANRPRQEWQNHQCCPIFRRETWTDSSRQGRSPLDFSTVWCGWPRGCRVWPGTLDVRPSPHSQKTWHPGRLSWQFGGRDVWVAHISAPPELCQLWDWLRQVVVQWNQWLRRMLEVHVDVFHFPWMPEVVNLDWQSLVVVAFMVRGCTLDPCQYIDRHTLHQLATDICGHLNHAQGLLG